MVFVALSLFMTQMILMPICTMLMTVCVSCDFTLSPLHGMFRLESTIITLADWYHTIAKEQILPAYVWQSSAGLRWFNFFFCSEAQSTLINGLGRFLDQDIPSELAVVTVEKGKR